MITWILNIFRSRSQTLTIRDALDRYYVAQFSNDASIRKTARADLDRALRGRA